jgi:molybdopterin-binding protein
MGCEPTRVRHFARMAVKHRVKNQVADSPGSCEQTPGGHHRIPKGAIGKHLRATLGGGGRDKWRIGSARLVRVISWLRRILGIKVDGLLAQVTLSIGDYSLTSIIPADAASGLGLKIGDTVVALLKSSQVMILQNQF